MVGRQTWQHNSRIRAPNRPFPDVLPEAVAPGHVRRYTSDSEDRDLFGFSVALNERSVVIGAPASRHADSTRWAGAAYLFDIPSEFSGVLSETVKLVHSERQPGDRAGWSVDIDENHVAVGAIYPNEERGAVYVYDVPSVGTGVPDVRIAEPKLSLSVFPNPARGIMQIHVGIGGGVAHLEVFDVLGRLVFSELRIDGSSHDPFIRWDATSTTPGSYLLRVVTEDGVRSRVVSIIR